METSDISMVKGDTFEFMVEFLDLSTDLNEAHFTCKKNPTDSNAIFNKTIGSGITKKSDGLYVVRVAPNDTNNVNAGWYHYDLEVTIGNDVYTILLGKLHILQDVTN